jgi:hypothetical protein
MAPKKKSRRAKAPKPEDARTRPAPIAGTAVVWPAGVEQRYGISDITRWRWERAGKLPPRDIHVGGRSGWRPETLASFESVQHPS